MTAEQERANLTDRYVKAYRLANSKEPDFEILYQRGWFYFFKGGRKVGSHRAAKLEEMAKTLEARAVARKVRLRWTEALLSTGDHIQEGHTNGQG